MLTDFKFQYLSVMRQRSPAMFKELTKSGELDEFVEMQVKEAVRTLRGNHAGQRARREWAADYASHPRS